MKFCFEMPFSCLEYFNVSNTFSFIINLYRKNKRYVNYMTSKPFRILDTGFYEVNLFGLNKKHLSLENIKEGIKIFEPNYVVPFEAYDKKNNLRNFLDFLIEFKNEKTKLLPVIHETNFNLESYLEQYKFFSQYTDLVGFPHHSLTTEERIQAINYITTQYKDGAKIHLLGVNNPCEAFLLKNNLKVFSVDTSSPIINGLNYVKYNEDGILNKKIYQTKNYMRQKILHHNQIECMEHNVLWFKRKLDFFSENQRSFY